MRYLVPVILASSLVTLGGTSVAELKQVRTHDELGRFIYRKCTEAVSLSDFLEALRSTEEIQPAPSKAPFQIRDVFQTIMIERFGSSLGLDEAFWSGVGWDHLRARCAYRSKDGYLHIYEIFYMGSHRVVKLASFLEAKQAEGLATLPPNRHYEGYHPRKRPPTAQMSYGLP